MQMKISELLEVTIDKILDETLKKVNGRWALVSRKNPRKVLQYYRGSGHPSKAWVSKVERRVHSFSETISDNLSYQGNCTDDDVIEHIFGDVNNFAHLVDEHGDEFELDDLVVKYDPDKDIHSFYYKVHSFSVDR